MGHLYHGYVKLPEGSLLFVDVLWILEPQRSQVFWSKFPGPEEFGLLYHQVRCL